MANQIPITPDRYTRVRFDVDDNGITTSPWGLGMSFDRITQSTDTNAIGCSLIKDQGWTISPNQFDLSRLHELSEHRSNNQIH